MNDDSKPGGLLRPRGGHGHAKVTNVELFFDLVFVFAVTQLSHFLLHDLSVVGSIETLLLLMAVWWVWIYTSWVTNWLDPDRTAVRILLFVLMLAGLVMSMSLPKAFTTMAVGFAGAHVLMQVGRSAYVAWAVAADDPGLARNFQRITLWLAVAGVPWLAGAFAEDARLALWIAAAAIEYAAPAAGFAVPGLGRSTTADWNVEGGHMAERCALFVIIALGESLLVTGTTFAALAWNATTFAAFVAAFLGSVAMWWIYFDTGAERGSARIARSDDPGRLARAAYTYAHLPIVAGIIVAAVGDEMVLVLPAGPIMPKTIAVLIGAPAIYLVGNLLFKRIIAGRLPLSHLVGLALLAALVPVAPGLDAVVLSAATTAVLLVVAAWETIALRR